MRAPLLCLAAGVVLLTACGKKKDGPTYNTGAREVRASQTVLLAIVVSDSISLAN
jgi:hypothetical protein